MNANNAERCGSIDNTERSRDISRAIMFAVCAPLGLEKIGWKIHPRGCVILPGITYHLPGTRVSLITRVTHTAVTCLVQ